MELKRPLDGPDSTAKRVAEGPLTPEDIELFQKDALYRQMKAYKAERDALKSQLEALQSSGDDALRSELERVTEQYLEACRQVERLKSPVVARCTMDPVKPDSDAQVKAETENGNETPQPTASNEESQQKLQELTEALDGAQALSLKQSEQLKTADQQVVAFEVKIRELEHQLAHLPDEMVRKYDSYALLERRNQDLQTDNTRLEQELQRQQDALGQLQGEQAFYEKNIRDNFEQQKHSLEKQLEQAEADVSRIRGVRDELTSELNVKKAAEQELVKQAEALKERLALAESKIAQSASQAEPAAVDDVVEGKSEPELRELALKLARQNKAFAAEIGGLEQAFAKAHSRANQKIVDQAAADAKVAALVTAKVKADEKYFGAMRARDALNIEYQQVKTALANSSEVISGLRVQEQKLVSNTARVQRQLAEAETKVVQVQRAQAQVERRRNELEQQLASARHEIQKVQSQLAARDGDVVGERSAKQVLEQQIEKLKKQVDVKQLTSGLGSAQAIQEQVESLRSIALCSLCTKNWKDTAIKVCGHVFCNDCAMARLNARMRKCPLCNSQFGQNDLLQVHL